MTRQSFPYFRDWPMSNGFDIIFSVLPPVEAKLLRITSTFVQVAIVLMRRVELYAHWNSDKIDISRAHGRDQVVCFLFLGFWFNIVTRFIESSHSFTGQPSGKNVHTCVTHRNLTKKYQAPDIGGEYFVFVLRAQSVERVRVRVRILISWTWISLNATVHVDQHLPRQGLRVYNLVHRPIFEMIQSDRKHGHINWCAACTSRCVINGISTTPNVSPGYPFLISIGRALYFFKSRL